jgi:hypothetical protein
MMPASAMRTDRTPSRRPARHRAATGGWAAWSRALGVWTLLCSFAHAGGAEPPPTDSALDVQLGVVGKRTTRYEGEVVEIELEVEFERAWVAAHAAPFARQPMDLPLRVRAPALRGSARLKPVELPGADEPGVVGASFALDDAVVRDAYASMHSLSRAGAPDSRWESSIVRRRFQLEGTGPLTLDAPVLDVLWSQEFRTGLLGERFPVQPRRATVAGEPLTLTVLPLPDAGRPVDFEGWIGRYEITSPAHPTTIAAGDTLHVAVTIEGQGNHMLRPAPRLTPPEGMHVTGRLEERTPDGWNVHLELEALDGARAPIVGFALDFFDPDRGEYVRAKGPMRRVRIEPDAAAAPASPPAVPDATPAAPAAPEEPAAARRWRTGLLLGALALVLALLLRARLVGAWRRAARAPSGVQVTADARAAALDVLARKAGTPAAGPALVDVLALHLGVPPAAVIAPDLAARLERSGLAPDLAAEAARAVEADVAARYAGPAGGGTSAISPEWVTRLAKALPPGAR